MIRCQCARLLCLPDRGSIAAALCALLLAAEGPGALAQEFPAAPTTPVDPRTCVTAECHAPVKDHRVLHGPVNVDACDACHTLADAKAHRFELTRPPNELCGFCHVVDTGTDAVVHQPLLDGDCASCHDPHGGFDTKFLRTRSMNQLCESCHQGVIGEAKHVHGPVAAGACGACHQPHSSPHEQLLVETGRDLCLSCHREMKQQLDAMPFKHEPAQQDCAACHDAHASDFPMLVRAEPMAVCTDACHTDVKQAVLDAPFGHSAVTEDSACANCHTPHGGELAGLMKARPIDLCMTCHDQPVAAGDDRTIPAMTELVDDARFRHGPVADGSCGGCHNVHGSDVSRLLVDPYPATFYAPFDAQDYKLCFACHDAQLVELPRTQGLTAFRNGAVNLHYLHVNKAERGRSCRACHNTHVARHEMNIRESVPYGNWELPINYTATDTGGSCAPGCHQELAYDRENPVALP